MEDQDVKWFSIITVFIFLLVAPFTFGVKFAAWLLDAERHLLHKPYKALKALSVGCLIMILLLLIYWNYNRME